MDYECGGHPCDVKESYRRHRLYWVLGLVLWIGTRDKSTINIRGPPALSRSHLDAVEPLAH